MNDKPQEPSELSLDVLKSLQRAVNKAIDKKKKLGQYAVFWDGKKPVKHYFNKKNK